MQQTADCIVSNLPYGVYCHVVPDTLRAMALQVPQLGLLSLAMMVALQSRVHALRLL